MSKKEAASMAKEKDVSVHRVHGTVPGTYLDVPNGTDICAHVQGDGVLSKLDLILAQLAEARRENADLKAWVQRMARKGRVA